MEKVNSIMIGWLVKGLRLLSACQCDVIFVHGAKMSITGQFGIDINIGCVAEEFFNQVLSGKDEYKAGLRDWFGISSKGLGKSKFYFGFMSAATMLLNLDEDTLLMLTDGVTLQDLQTLRDAYYTQEGVPLAGLVSIRSDGVESLVWASDLTSNWVNFPDSDVKVVIPAILYREYSLAIKNTTLKSSIIAYLRSMGELGVKGLRICGGADGSSCVDYMFTNSGSAYQEAIFAVLAAPVHPVADSSKLCLGGELTCLENFRFLNTEVIKLELIRR